MSTHDDELVELQRTLYTSKNPTRRWLHRSRHAWITATIDADASGVRRALEVGPGAGVYLTHLADVADLVVASDVEYAYLDRLRPIAEQRPNVNLVRDDITQSSFDSASFDLLLCTEVIEHIADSPRALREMRRLLAPRGTLILSTPQRYSPLEVCGKVAFLPGVVEIVRWVYKEPILETGHINLMTRRELQRQLADAGLAVRATALAGVYLPVAAEALGERALRWEQWLEPRLRRHAALSWLLWTQLVVAVPTDEP